MLLLDVIDKGNLAGLCEPARGLVGVGVDRREADLVFTDVGSESAKGEQGDGEGRRRFRDGEVEGGRCGENNVAVSPWWRRGEKDVTIWNV